MPERSHTPMGHAHCTSGAPTCSEIPHSLAWSRKAPSIHDVPRGGTVRVLTNRDVKPSGRVLRLCPAFCLREARWWLQLEVRKTSNLHYTTALHTISPVFTHHTSVSYHACIRIYIPSKYLTYSVALTMYVAETLVISRIKTTLIIFVVLYIMGFVP